MNAVRKNMILKDFKPRVFIFFPALSEEYHSKGLTEAVSESM